MRNRKAIEDTDSLKNKPSAMLAESLAALFSHQIELGLDAVKCRQNGLAQLVACQIFDALDWARLNLGKESSTTLEGHILAHLKGPARRFRSLGELEEYAEKHLSGLPVKESRLG